MCSTIFSLFWVKVVTLSTQPTPSYPPVIKHGVLDNPQFYFDDLNLHVVWGCVGISQLTMFDY